ncbi:c-type cytochrome [Caenispirillum bisanense]|uniref:Cytochrome c556 n=1 Tax=Caenispirillum bisanense TaxID=414052 RepID=A0A286G280_9PROT|nr:cytochrome c [Caenispirillum bisanense]SOD89625.1 Cytochrome c556 [Caenispirillum bisanense]
MKFAALAAAAAVFAATAVAPVAASANEAAVKYRQNNMKAVGAYMQNTVAVLKGEVPYAEQLEANALGLAAAAKLSPAAFKTDTSGSDVKTTAKADIWQNWEKFEGGLTMMAERSDALVAAVQGGDKAAIGQAVQAVGETCKTCHDNFRTK